MSASVVSMAPADIQARLERASELADLRPERRLHAKLDMSAAGILRRLELAAELGELCAALGEAGAKAQASSTSTTGC